MGSFILASTLLSPTATSLPPQSTQGGLSSVCSHVLIVVANDQQVVGIVGNSLRAASAGDAKAFGEAEVNEPVLWWCSKRQRLKDVVQAEPSSRSRRPRAPRGAPSLVMVEPALEVITRTSAVTSGAMASRPHERRNAEASRA